MLKRASGIFLLMIILTFIIGNAAAEGLNLVLNPGFENISGNMTDGWQRSDPDNHSKTGFVIDSYNSHSGKSSLEVINRTPGNSRYRQPVVLKPDTMYRLSCWIRTENIGEDNTGAGILINGYGEALGDIRGTNNKWEFTQAIFNSSQTSGQVTISIGIGDPQSKNTGKAWFDDIVIEEYSYSSAVKLDSASKSIGIYTALFMILFISVYLYMKKRNNKTEKRPLKRKRRNNIPKQASVLQTDSHLHYLFFALLAAGLAIRVLLAPWLEGFPFDVLCFKTWSSYSADNFTGIYKAVFPDNNTVDYPPLYIYVLFIIGKAAKILGIYTIPWAYVMLLKLPSILADILTTYLIYKIAIKKLQPSYSIFLSAVYLFNPTVILNSTIWGQVDSVFTLLITAAVYLLEEGKIAASSSLFAASILMKPQGIIFLPILGLQLLKTGKLKNFLISIASALAVVFVSVLPFSLSMGPLWILKLYFNTIGQFPFASLNAYNLFELFEGNLIKDSSSFLIFSFNTWGNIFIILITAFVGYVYYKSKDKSAVLISALILVTGVFTLSSRMHERYLFPVLAVSILAFIYTRRNEILVLLGVFSLTTYINTGKVLFNMLKGTGSIPGFVDATIAAVSLANIACFIYILKFSLDFINGNEIFNKSKNSLKR